MPRWLHIVLQVLVQVAGGYAAYKTGTPLPSVIAGGVSATVGVAQQAYNTDGTPQTTAFIPSPLPPIKPIVPQQ